MMGLPTSKLGDECSEQRFASAEVALLQEQERRRSKLSRSTRRHGFILRHALWRTAATLRCTLRTLARDTISGVSR